MDPINLSFEDKPSTNDNETAFEDLNKLMNELRTKFHSLNSHADKVQILTLKPTSWTIEKTADFFQCTTYIVRQATALKLQHGVLAKSTRVTRRGIGEEVVSLVTSF